MKSRGDRQSSRAIPVLLIWSFACLFLAPPAARAIPGFARKHDVKCYNCHTIPPVLNKTGYLYKRYGYRLPPDYEPGTAPVKLSEIDRNFPWRFTDSAAFFFNPNFRVHRQSATGEPSTSNSSFETEELELFLAGRIPKTEFSYFVETEFKIEEAELVQAVVAYASGKVNSSYILRAGKMFLQEAEGTRAAMGFSLFPSGPLQFEHTSPVNFSLDHKPVGIQGGYTWTSPWYRNIVAVSAKLTNGVDEEGEAIAADSTKNFKDFWFNADWWFGPDGGVTFLAYHGKKDQEGEDGLEAFTFRPAIRRYGLFGNYLFFDKLDLIGGYVRSDDDWKWALAGAAGHARSNSFRGEVNYYFFPGLAVMARYDRLNQEIQGGHRSHIRSWAIGGAKSLTETGNIIIRGSYGDDRGADPLSLLKSRDRRFIVDLKVIW